MADTLEELLNRAKGEVENCISTDALNIVEIAYLGRNGSINALRKTIGTLSTEDRPTFGAKINSAVDQLTKEIEAKRVVLSRAELEQQLAKERIDVTLPGSPFPLGGLHPLTQTTNQIKRVLSAMGYEFVDGPELEEYKYNFAALNYPEDHPAMDEQNSFFVTNNRLMRTQTTALQGRMMEERKPPFRIATVGRCYRYEAVDATHHHTFHQVDVFMVDEGLSMADLKGTLAEFARSMFGAETTVRFRPDFFPFVEPGVDYSIKWRDRWLELGGAGMIHPNILRNHGIDSERYTGFAFGLGVERTHMIRTGVNDLRLYLENDLRFLQQFAGGSV